MTRDSRQTGMKRVNFPRVRCRTGLRVLALAVLGLPFVTLSARAEAPAGETSSSSAKVTEAPAEDSQELEPVLFDKDKPIEITSDRLDVDQEAQIAVFAGRVDAIQGDFHLTADILTVHYDQPKADATAGAPPKPRDPTGSGGQIRRMDVTGHVKIVSPTETATGDTAIYKVESGTIDLLGNVVLTRGKNVIRGTKLTTNVDTGKSVIVGGNQSAGGGTGRVKSLFVPAEKKEGAKAEGSAPKTP